MGDIADDFYEGVLQELTEFAQQQQPLVRDERLREFLAAPFYCLVKNEEVSICQELLRRRAADAPPAPKCELCGLPEHSKSCPNLYGPIPASSTEQRQQGEPEAIHPMLLNEITSRNDVSANRDLLVRMIARLRWDEQRIKELEAERERLLRAVDDDAFTYKPPPSVAAAEPKSQVKG